MSGSINLYEDTDFFMAVYYENWRILYTAKNPKETAFNSGFHWWWENKNTCYIKHVTDPR
jgi:hypothetical protein